MKKMNAYRDGQVHVKRNKCETCIFRPGNLMRLEGGRVAEMVRLSLQNGSAIICHDTLDGGRKQANSVCRGFFDLHANDVLPLRLCRIFGNMVEDQ